MDRIASSSSAIILFEGYRVSSSPATPAPFLRLPHEMMVLIFSYLTIEEIKQARLVCREWRNIGSDEQVWKVVAERLEAHPLVQAWELVSQELRLCRCMANALVEQPIVPPSALVKELSCRGYFFEIRSRVVVDLTAHRIDIKGKRPRDIFGAIELRHLLESIFLTKYLLPPKSYLYSLHFQDSLDANGVIQKTGVGILQLKHPQGLQTNPYMLTCLDEGAYMLSDEMVQTFLRQIVPPEDVEDLSTYHQYTVNWPDDQIDLEALD